MDINFQLPQIQRFPGWSEYTRRASLQALAPPALSNSAMNAVNQQRQNLFKQYQTQQNKNQLLGQAVSSLTGQLSNQVSEGIFGTDTELGQAMGNLFSTGINTAGDQVVNNIFKGESLMNGMSQNVGSSLAGAGAGIAANYIGKGISSLGGNSKLSRGLGAGFATGAGTLGGGALSNIINGERAFGDIVDSFKAIKTFNQAKKAADFAKGSPEALEALKASKLGTLNLAGLGASVVGTGLQAAFGPSKEYGGTYGNITRGLDTAYDLVQGAAGFIPGVGTAVSGFMALNKGLSNIFGSTSGMTRQDAILGSAFMPASVKWLNMAGAKTTDKFRNQSWQNQERTNTFMQNGFGDLGEKFDKARRESGKTYGTFSRHTYNKAQGNLNFANDAFNKILDMADDEEIRRIRSEYMTSINNQRYAQDITGGFRPLYRGKEGMKIPEINHNFGQRLLSGAALIDNKQMILSAQNGNKIFATNSRGDNYYLSPSALASNEVNVTVPETFVTANPDDVARGNAQRWWKEHSNVYNEKGLKQVSPEFDLITLSPLLKPVVNTGLRSAGRIIGKANRFANSPLTGNWTKIGNREYRLSPNSLGANGSPVESRAVAQQITSESASSITPEQWTAAQDAAIARDDMAEAQRLRDLHSKVYGDPIISYHGQMMPDEMYISRRANPYSDVRTSHSASGYFSSSSNPVANTYNFIDGSPTFKLYTHFKNPYMIDAKGRNWRTIGTDRIYRDYVENGKHDGVVIRNVIDVGSRRDKLNGASEIADDIISSPGHSKLADAVTFDDNGIRIPLGKRDNFKLNDIRYSWLPWFLGGSTAATLYNTNK